MKEFNSQICTTKEQSERLLALGVKEETADFPVWGTEKLLYMGWSLHRLIELALCDVEMNIFISRRCFWINKPHLSPTRSDLEGGVFDGMIDYIEWLIKEGYFNKEYLNENIH